MNVVAQIETHFPNAILAVSEPYGMPTLVIRKEAITEMMHYLYSQPELQFQFLTTLCGMHYPTFYDLPDDLQEVAQKNPDIFPPSSGVYGVVYHLHNLYSNQRLRIKAFSPISDVSFPSLTSLFSAANWMERETYDFFGLEFQGHPNLTRILNMDEMTYFPLRKEYALEDATRQDKNDTFFGRTQGNE